MTTSTRRTSRSRSNHKTTDVGYIVHVLTSPGIFGSSLYLVEKYPRGYFCTWYRYILCAISVPGILSCALFLYRVQIYPVRYSCTWYMYILCAIPVPGTCISCALFLYLVHVSLYPVRYSCTWYYIYNIYIYIYPVRYSCTWYRYIRYQSKFWQN